jgi:phosphoglycolate phosphatase-like HAD superfamily hydrolase
MRLPEEVAASAGYRVLEGVGELLPRLCKAGFLLGITTGAVEAAAHIKLARANLNRFFSFGGYGSDSADRGELTRRAIARAGEILGSPLDPQRVLVLGDTPKDIAAAHAAGAIGVGVASEFDRDLIDLPAVMVNSWDGDMPAVLQPVFDAFWQAAGRSRSENYDADGVWQKPD